MRFIIVLGSSNKNIIKKRVDVAIEYFNRYNAELRDLDLYDNGYIEQYLILSGGGSPVLDRDKNVPANKRCIAQTESEYMRQYAILKGIPQQFILTESKSVNTEQNIINSKKMVDTFSYGGINTDIIICTSKFHALRAKVISQNIMKGYNLSFIYPEEEVSFEQHNKEMISMYKYMLSTFEKTIK